MLVFLSLRRMTDELYSETNPTPPLLKYEESGDRRTVSISMPLAILSSSRRPNLEAISKDMETDGSLIRLPISESAMTVEYLSKRRNTR